MTTTLYTIVEDKETHEQGSVFAIVQGQLGTVAVALKDTGATRFYCIQHQRMYIPKNSCPECDLDNHWLDEAVVGSLP